MQDIRLIELPNGIRVLHRYIPHTRIAHVGYVLNTGSRDDDPNHLGLAHFVEHMIFKGTPTRKTFHVLNYLEAVGGDVNAYTTKEKTAVYASLPAEYASRAAELLTDIVFRSTFPEKEIAKEQQVIAEEIDSYRDAPDEAIFEDYDLLLYPDHALGAPILGTKESILTLTQEHLRAHIQGRYTQGNVVFCIVGNVPNGAADRLIHAHVRPLVLPAAPLVRTAPAGISPFVVEKPTSGTQAHEILGGHAISFAHGDHYPFWLLHNLLGGPAMNTRLNLNIREKHGLAYSISAFYSPFSDSGQWGVYYACDPGSLKRIRKLVHKELDDLRNRSLGGLKLREAIRQSVGQLLLGQESVLSQMLAQAKDLLDFGEIEDTETIIKRIGAITAPDLLRLANENFPAGQLSRISYLPEDEEEE